MIDHAERMRVGDVLQLVREPVTVDPAESYTSIGVRSFGRGLFHYEPTDGSRLSKLRWYRLRPRELVVSNIKAWEGAIAVSTQQEVGCIASNRFLTYRAKDGRVDLGYLRYFFLSEPGLRLIGRASPGSADRNRTLAIDRFEDLKIRLPVLDDQRRVANNIDRILLATAQLDSLLSSTENHPGTILQSARLKMTHPPSSNGKPQIRHTRLGELAEFMNGTSYETAQMAEEGLPIIRISNISDPNSAFRRTVQRFEERFIVMPGDLLVTWSASFKSIIWPGPTGVLNQHIFKVEQSQDNDRRYLRHLIEAVFDGMRRQSVGIGMMHLRRDAFLDYPVAVPDLETQIQIAERLDRIEAQVAKMIERQRQAKSLLKSFRTSILNHAFAGTL